MGFIITISTDMKTIRIKLTLYEQSKTAQQETIIQRE